ncbi:MAG: type II secretion system protein GspL [Pseudomonadota bacterium]
MSDRLFVLLGETPEVPLTWLRVQADGRLAMRGQASDYATFANNPPAREGAFVALLPGELTALRLLPTPPRGQAQFLSAAHYLLEDSLAEAIDDLHVCVARQGTSGQCLGIADDIMVAWAEAFRQTGLTPDILTADYFALPQRDSVAPVEEPTNPMRGDDGAQLGAEAANDDPSTDDNSAAPLETVIIFIHADGLLARGPKGGVSIDRLTAEAVLQPLLDQWAPDHIDLYTEVCPDFLRDHPALTLHTGADMNALAQLAGEAFTQRAVVPNFLSGNYGRKTDWRAAVMPWRGVAAAAGLFAVVLSGAWLAEGWRNERQAERLASLTRDIHRNAFPQATTEDPVAHARRVLSASGGGVTFNALWVGFSGAVDGRQGVQVEHFRFVNGGRALQVGVLVDTLDTLGALKAALAENGIQAEEGAMNRTSGGLFSGELTVGR